MESWKEQIAWFRLQRIVQEALDQPKISLLLFISGLENSNSIYPHETAKSPKNFDVKKGTEVKFSLQDNGCLEISIIKGAGESDSIASV